VDRKHILALNAFDRGAAGPLGAALDSSLRQRAKLFGAASVLFYDRPLEFVRGKGCRLYDAAGLAYLDAYNNVPSVGHCHPHVVEAVTRQLGSLNVHSRYLHQGVMEYAERLLATLPSGAALSNVTFTCTGSESNDLALRLAAHFTGARGVIVTEAAYHGNTAAVTDISPSLFAPRAPAPHVRVIPAPDSYRVPPGQLSGFFAQHVAAAIADLEHSGVGFAALIVDSIFSSDGVFAGPPGFMRAGIDAVHRAQGVFIADEVQCGFGRTGAAMWGCARHGLMPDIVTLGKPMGNGLPVGAVVTRPEILAALCSEVGYFNTFGGSPVAAAAGDAVLDVIEREGLMENAAHVGGALQRALQELATRHPAIGDVRGAGFYIGVELVKEGGGPDAPDAVKEGGPAPAPELAKTVINGLRERRVLIGAAGKFGNVLKIRPPLCFSAADAEELVAALDDVLTHVSARA
jgi:4-aminobutyrate aminotransferase-like enzyme